MEILLCPVQNLKQRNPGSFTRQQQHPFLGGSIREENDLTVCNLTQICEEFNTNEGSSQLVSQSANCVDDIAEQCSAVQSNPCLGSSTFQLLII